MELDAPSISDLERVDAPINRRGLQAQLEEVLEQ
jgi:hypothetical protein